MSAHLGDDVELYALGVLEPVERDAVDAHLATCAQCSERVARAERIVVALEGISWDQEPATIRIGLPLFGISTRSTWFAVASALTLAVRRSKSWRNAKR